MTSKFLYIYWALMYVICAVLGFVGLPGWVGLVGSLVFFIPPAILLYRAIQAGEQGTIRRIRNISILWLAAAMLMIILNIASVYMSAVAGNILYGIMIVLTAPMVCSGFWLLPMFCWACLLIVSLQQLKR